MRISDWSSDVCSSDLDVAALQGLDRQQAVVDRAERGAGADDDGDLPSGEQVGVEGGGRYRNERAAGNFADQVPGRRAPDFDADVDHPNFRGAMPPAAALAHASSRPTACPLESPPTAPP